MERSFIIKSAKTGGCYCGKCGKKVLNDRYNMRKHAELCGFEVKKEDDVLFMEEENGWSYHLEGREDAVVLLICTPRLKVIRGFEDRFYGAEWLPVFEARFPAGSKSPDIVKNETGFEMEILLSLIRAGRIVPFYKERDAMVIREVFPCIDVESLQMFVYIYRNRGFRAEGRISPGAERRLFKGVPGSGEAQAARGGAEAPGVQVGGAQAARGDAGQAENGDDVEKIPLQAAIYRYRKERYILQIVLYWKGEQIVFLFSRGYCACSKAVDLGEMLKEQYFVTGKAKAAVLKFDEIYPEYLLAQYMKRSSNVLVPLVAADYHVGMELAAKAGAAGIAEGYDQLTAFRRPPGSYRNLKELFGVPVSVLRALGREQVCDAALERVKQIYDYRPAFLQFETITDSMMRFFMRADITRSGEWGIEGIRELSDRQIQQILRYLEKHPEDGHYYCDYLSACAQLGEYLYGLTPDIPIRLAHDRTVARIKNDHDLRTQEAFIRVVSRYEYLKLTTDRTEEDEEYFKEDPFVVIAPTESGDLFIESENMHNCVRLYVNSVMMGNSRIYFLRKKKDPEKCFGTLEVTGDGSKLTQAKAFANERLSREAQLFLVKWCAKKQIRIATWDVKT